MPEPLRIDSRYRPDAPATPPDESWWELAMTAAAGLAAALWLFLVLAVAIALCAGLWLALDWGLRWLR